MEKPTSTCVENLRKPSQLLIRKLLVYFFISFIFFLGLELLNADNKTFPNCQIKEISNFKRYYNEIFQIVADRMGLRINKSIPKPIIFTDKQITLRKFNSDLGFDSNQIFPCYFSKHNTIVIPLNCKLDNLAHELVHYFQVMYRNEDLSYDYGLPTEVLEMEAVEIQKWFKAKYIKHH